MEGSREPEHLASMPSPLRHQAVRISLHFQPPALRPVPRRPARRSRPRAAALPLHLAATTASGDRAARHRPRRARPGRARGADRSPNSARRAAGRPDRRALSLGLAWARIDTPRPRGRRAARHLRRHANTPRTRAQRRHASSRTRSAGRPLHPRGGHRSDRGTSRSAPNARPDDRHRCSATPSHHISAGRSARASGSSCSSIARRPRSRRFGKWRGSRRTLDGPDGGCARSALNDGNARCIRPTHQALATGDWRSTGRSGPFDDQQAISRDSFKTVRSQDPALLDRQRRGVDLRCGPRPLPRSRPHEPRRRTRTQPPRCDGTDVARHQSSIPQVDLDHAHLHIEHSPAHHDHPNRCHHSFCGLTVDGCSSAVPSTRTGFLTGDLGTPSRSAGPSIGPDEPNDHRHLGPPVVLRVGPRGGQLLALTCEGHDR